METTLDPPLHTLYEVISLLACYDGQHFQISPEAKMITGAITFHTHASNKCKYLTSCWKGSSHVNCTVKSSKREPQ